MTVRRKVFRSPPGGEVLALQDLNVVLKPGCITCLVGPSGCGKTTLIRILLGLETDFEGAVDLALLGMRKGAVFQEPSLLPWRTVEENIRLSLPPGEERGSIEPLLEAVGLLEFRRSFPAELSLGMARRAAIARAFWIRPRFLTLDEPFVSLDPKTTTVIRDLFLSLWESERNTVLMVTHDLEEALAIADRIVFLSARPGSVLGTFDMVAERPVRSRNFLDAARRELNLQFGVQ